jgi:hypothetical protein
MFSSLQLETTGTCSLQYSHFSCTTYMKWKINKYATYYFFLFQNRLIFIKVCIDTTECWYWNMNLDRICGIQDRYLTGGYNWIFKLIFKYMPHWKIFKMFICVNEKYLGCIQIFKQWALFMSNKYLVSWDGNQASSFWWLPNNAAGMAEVVALNQKGR